MFENYNLLITTKTCL